MEEQRQEGRQRKEWSLLITETEATSRGLPAPRVWGGGCGEGVSVGKGPGKLWEQGTDSVLGLESDESSLNLCCALCCVTLSRYLNFSELQFPHL